MGSKRSKGKNNISNRKKRKHGFRARKRTPGGKKILKRRRKKGRKRIAKKVPKFKGN